MFGSLKDKLKKSVEKLTKKAEEEDAEAHEAEELAEEKLEHEDEDTSPEHEHRELPEKEKEETKKRTFSLTKRLLKEEDLEDVLWELQLGLIENDVAMETAEKLCERIKEELVDTEVSRRKVKESIENAFGNAVRDVLQQDDVDLVSEVKSNNGSYKVVFIGFNGAGKTTTIARVAKKLQDAELSCVLAAGDTWRAAAIQQLEKHGDALDVRVVSQDYGSDAAAVIYDAVKYAEKNDIDAVLADTAGRSHKDRNLMDELHKIIRVIEPDRKMLVIDSLTGNDAVEQARSFTKDIEIDGVILTKMDVNEKGGAALSVADITGVPIYYIGVGQEYDDLQLFEHEKIADALLE